MTDLSRLDRRRIETLLAIMQALRAPGSGCPWDLEQTFETIAPYTIEEAYEVADAIARGARDELREELGDLLLQVVYYARMAEEEGAFAFDDVVEAICRKMVRRHPHVFGDGEARSAKLAKGFWEEMKARERRERPEGLLTGIALALPALSRAVKLQSRAAEAGFDWPDVSQVHDKIDEELRELRAAEGEAVEEEFGDVMFAMANLARHLEIDPEAALRKANAKFERRFLHIETRLAEQGRSPAQSSLAEMDALWDEAKETGM